MKQVRFTFIVGADNIKDVRMKQTELKVVANLLFLNKNIKPLIQIRFEDVDILDVMNVKDMSLVKYNCEIAAEKEFRKSGDILTSAFVLNSVNQLQNQN